MRFRTVTAITLLTGAAIALANPSGAKVELRARAVSVLSLTLPADTPPAYEVKISFDGKTFLPPPTGLPRAERLFTSAETSAGSTTVSVLVVAGFETGEFIFARPGEVAIEWIVAPEGKVGDPEIITQQAVVREPSPDDEAFLAKLGHPELLRRLFGEDYFDRQTATVKDRLLAPGGEDERALRVVAQLLLATRAAEPTSELLARSRHGDGCDCRGSRQYVGRLLGSFARYGASRQ